MSGTERLNAALAGRYKIEKQLGQGGMATVYLAKDIKHDRMVAVKVLKPELAAVLGAERFVVEIKTTASLQHPHILPLFDSGTADGFLYYVMPYIEGETLRDKLRRETQFGIDEAVRITTQVADALDYAHRHGVIHRDIKPENILLHDGRPMVADFGIALAVSAAAGGRMTETGLSLGTPHYMSPEQATADKDITARSDIYSLASVMYEMLAGQPPHMGNSAQMIIMRIIAEPVEAVTKFRKTVPQNVADALAKALEKLPADRFDSAKAFADALRNSTFTSATRAGASVSGLRSSVFGLQFAVGVSIAIVVTAVVTWLATHSSAVQTTAPATVRFLVGGPSDSTVQSFGVRAGFSMAEPTISSDGRYVAFSVQRTDGPALYLRDLTTFDANEVPGQYRWPFFSHDGTRLGFFTDEQVWAMDVRDRLPARVGTVPESAWDITGVVWHPDGRILVTGVRGLWALPARSGEPTLLVAADSATREVLIEPTVLADGRIVVNRFVGSSYSALVVSPDGSGRRAAFSGLSLVRVVDDIAIFGTSGQSRATRFDPVRLEATGEPVTLPEFSALGAAVGQELGGVVVLRPGRSIAWRDASSVREQQLVWVTRGGVATPVGLPGAIYRWPRLSPDGRRMVVGQFGLKGYQLQVIDLVRRTRALLAGGTEPVWTLDGNSVFSSSGTKPFGGIVRQVSDASLRPDTLLRMSSGDAWPTGLSPDGLWLAHYGSTTNPGDGAPLTDASDLQFLDLKGRGVKRFRIPGDQKGARFSPDGKWVAYESTESGRSEIHVRPWPAMDADHVVSSSGGTEPAWSANGKELFYRSDDRVMEVSIATRDGRLDLGAPRMLFSGPYARDPYGDQGWDLAPDGRFLMLRPIPGGSISFRVALNWIDEVRAKLASAKK